jgi:hypothetical protein
MENTQKDTLNPGKLIDQKLLGFFFDREQEGQRIQKVIFDFEEHQLQIKWDVVNHTFMFGVSKK